MFLPGDTYNLSRTNWCKNYLLLGCFLFIGLVAVVDIGNFPFLGIMRSTGTHVTEPRSTGHDCTLSHFVIYMLVSYIFRWPFRLQCKHSLPGALMP